MSNEEVRADSKRSALRHPLVLVVGLVVALGAVGLVYDTLSGEPESEAAGVSGRIYWGNTSNGTISFANADGSGGGGDLNTAGVTVASPAGVAIDPGGNRVWWAEAQDDVIAHARLDGGGGAADLGIQGISLDSPVGVVVDSAAGRLYFANAGLNRISYANLDGSGGTNVNTAGATVDSPHGVTVNPARTRIYWANYSASVISYAELDGSGGGDLDTSGATVSSPNGVALDPATGRIWWANRGAGISYANADGSGGGGNLDTTGATENAPYGVAVDGEAGRIWWANHGSLISYAELDGSGGGDLDTSGASLGGPNLPALLKAPEPTGAPAVTGTPVVGAPLRCAVSWAPDLFSSNLYRTPSSVGYEWYRDGALLAGIDSASLAPDAPGAYSCKAVAANPMGSATQATPGAFSVTSALSLGKPKLNKKKGTAKLPASPRAAGSLRLSGKGVATQTRAVDSAQTVKLAVKPTGKLKRTLASKGKASVKVKVSFTPTGGTPTTLSKKLKLSKRLP